jgi:hypothetical protein
MGQAASRRRHQRTLGVGKTYRARALGQGAAIRKKAQVPFHEPENQASALPSPSRKALEMAGDKGVEYALFRPARALLAGGFAHGRNSAAEYKIAPLQFYVPFENSCFVRPDHALARLAAAPRATI